MSANERPPLAAIFGCAGPVLSDEERRFFAAANPLGFIVFARNVTGPAQVRELVASLRACVERDDAPVLIDQEGGRVRRLRPPHWRDYPPMAPFGDLFATDPAAARRALRLNLQLLAEELALLGIDVNCAPVLDVPAAGAHDIIGDRAFAADPAVVAELGRVACQALLSRGVLPVVKHLPGHGRATADSHESLPVVHASRQDLEAIDFAPFRALADAPLGMTAHVLYPALDAERPATVSPKVIAEVVRDAIGFDGLLMTDDLSMKALGGSFADRAALSLAAGCDIVLHCNGEMAEMRQVAQGCLPMNDAAMLRWQRARRKVAARREPLDVVAAVAELAALLPGSAASDPGPAPNAG